jgi:hydrolase, NUDIX family
MKVIYSDQKIVVPAGQKSIFLAGPTPRDQQTPSWRIEALTILDGLGFNDIVFVPESSNGQPKEDYINQTEWEYAALHIATTIAFWIPRSLPDMPGFTTNVEFGYWVKSKSGKVLYGRPDTAEKIKYLDWLYNKVTGQQPVNELTALLALAIER